VLQVLHEMPFEHMLYQMIDKYIIKVTLQEYINNFFTIVYLSKNLTVIILYLYLSLWFMYVIISRTLDLGVYGYGIAYLFLLILVFVPLVMYFFFSSPKNPLNYFRLQEFAIYIIFSGKYNVHGGREVYALSKRKLNEYYSYRLQAKHLKEQSNLNY